MTAGPARPAIVLVGLPGAGKTTVGRAVAERLGWPFVDVDEAIEAAAGRRVAEIFAAEGEGSFRAREREATRALVGRGELVIAPGGGWIENPGCVALLRPPASIIHLRVSPAAALARMGAGRGGRPLLAGPDPAGALDALRRRREPLYEAADWSIDTELLDIERVIRRVAELASVGGPA